MRNIYLMLLTLLIQLCASCLDAQTIRADVNLGSQSAHESYSITFKPPAYSIASGSYVIATNLYYMVPQTRASPFIEGEYLFRSFPTPSVQELQAPILNMNGYQIAIGISTFQPLGQAQLALLASIGYRWNMFNVNHPSLKSFSLSSDATIYNLGFNLYFPFFNFVDATFGYRISFSSRPNLSGTIQGTDYHLEGASIFQTILIGFSVPIKRGVDK